MPKTTGKGWLRTFSIASSARCRAAAHCAGDDWSRSMACARCAAHCDGVTGVAATLGLAMAGGGGM